MIDEPELPEGMREEGQLNRYAKRYLKSLLSGLEKPRNGNIDIDLSIAELALAQRERQQELFDYSCKPKDKR